MNTKIIEYVIAIAEEKSLSKAASRLYISQPALSQRLKKLEEELGTPLFHREKDGLAITDAGRIYINGGRSILKIKEDALHQIRSLDSNTDNTLRFGCACMEALECIHIFRENFPDTELITMNNTTPLIQTALLTGRLDMAVMLTTSLQHNLLEFLPLKTCRMYLAVPDGHPILQEENPSQNGYEALKNDYFILRQKPSFSRDREEDIIRRWNFQPKVLCETSDNISRRYMLNQGLGTSFVHDYMIQEEDKYHVLPLNPPVEYFIVAAYPKYITLTETMKELIKICLTLFEK